MKRINLIFTIAVFLIAGFSIPTASANGNLDEILNNMQKSAASIKTIYARMEQVKRDPQIGGSEKYSGEIFFKHVGKNNDKVRINYSKPSGQSVWVIGNDITLYQAAINQAIVTTRGAAASKGNEFSVVATPYASVPDLKRQYNIVHAGDEQGMAKLELTPKGKSSIKSLTLWVDQSTWLPTKYHVVEGNGTATTFTLSGLKTNGVIPNGNFEVKLPKDTQIIRK
ncbi:MAG: outer membrane lipoprotein carrier protein LolA [Blastocatellia bacterium]